jgi:hypothetical protein
MKSPLPSQRPATQKSLRQFKFVLSEFPDDGEVELIFGNYMKKLGHGFTQIFTDKSFSISILPASCLSV